MNHKGTVTIETKRLILRRFTPNDAEAMFRNWASDAEVTKYLTWPTHSDISVSQAVLKSWISLYENPAHYSWAIVLKNINEPIGSIAAVEQRDDIKMVHVGYCIGQSWWRLGYTSEAFAALIRFFFEDVGVNRIETRHDPRNPNSGKVMQKCGLKYEGILRQSDINNQGLCDGARYAIFAEDYFNEQIISVRENPEYYERAVDYFSAKWGIDRKIYEESVADAMNTDKSLPRWYLMLRGDDIIGSYGLIENDFIVRKDLMPWLCALYVEESERGKVLGAKLLRHGQEEAGKLGFNKVYLCTDHAGYYEKYGWTFFGTEESEFGGNARAYSISAVHPAGFWSALDSLLSLSEVVIDRPKGTKHPRLDFIYPLDYGYLKDTTSPDGGGMDLWRGSLGGNWCDAIICTVDLLKRDSEIKILLGCTEAEKEIILRFHNDSELMKGVMIKRGDDGISVY